MATVDTLQNQEQEQSTMNVLAPGNAPIGETQGQEAPTLGGPQGGSIIESGAPAMAAGESSSKFAGLQNFFAGNKDAGKELAEKITTKAGKTAADTGAAVEQKMQEYQQKGQQAQQAIQGGLQYGTGLIQNIQQGQTNLTPDQLKQYQAYNAGKNLQGQSLADIGKFDVGKQQAIQQNLAKQAGGAGTATGTFDLLKSYFSTPGRAYTAGQQSLDAALLRQSQEAQQSLKSGLSSAATGLGQKVSTSQQSAQQLGQSLGEGVKSLQQSLEEKRLAADKGLIDVVSGKASEVAAKRKAIIDQIQAAGGNIGSLSDDLKQQLGIPTSADYRKSIADLNTNEYLLGGRAEDIGAKAVIGQMLAGKDTGLGLDQSAFMSGLNKNYDIETLKGMYATQQQLDQAKALAQLVNKEQDLVVDPTLVSQYQGRGLGSNYGLGWDQAAAESAVRNQVAQYLASNATGDVGDYDKGGEFYSIHRMAASKALQEGKITPDQYNRIMHSNLDTANRYGASYDPENLMNTAVENLPPELHQQLWSRLISGVGAGSAMLQGLGFGTGGIDPNISGSTHEQFDAAWQPQTGGFNAMNTQYAGMNQENRAKTAALLNLYKKLGLA